MAQLIIEMLGGLEIRLGPDEVILSRKNKTVVAVLALAGAEGFSRQTLAELVWADSPDAQARTSLRQALVGVRRALGPARLHLHAERDRVWLDPGAVELDARMFDELADRGDPEHLERAAALYRGDLLDGFVLKEEAVLSWLLPRRVRLRAKASEVLGALVERAGSDAERLTRASQLLSLDPTDEVGHRAMMRAYAAQGRPNAALKQFALCRDVLMRDLGVPPSVETVRLADVIRLKRRVGARPLAPPVDTALDALPARTEAVATAGREKPTVVVLPFEDLTEEAAQSHLAAGITRDLISALWRHRTLTVTSTWARTDAGQIRLMERGRVVDAPVDYVLSGGVRMKANRVRVDVQLIDADSGVYVWADSYALALEDVLGLQVTIAGSIAACIEPEIGQSERNKVIRAATSSLASWDCYHLGMHHFYRFTSADNRKAQELFARSVEIDPELGEGHAWWSYTRILAMVYYDEPFLSRTLEEAIAAASTAVELDDRNAVFHTLLARALLAAREYDRVLSHMRLAVELNPNMPLIYCGMGDALAYEGRFEEAMRHFETALALGPRDPVRWAFYGYGALAQIFAGRHEAAETWASNAIAYPRCQFWAYAHRVAALGHLGGAARMREARAALETVQPGFSCEFARSKLFFIKDANQLRIYLDGLRRAGVP